MDGWSYYYIRIALAILFYICLVELIPFFVCSLIKYLFRAKTVEFHVDLFHGQVRDLVYSTAKHEIKISIMKVVPKFSFKKLSLCIELSKVRIYLDEGNSCINEHSTGSLELLNPSHNLNFSSHIESFKRFFRFFAISCDSLQVEIKKNETSKSMLLLKSSLSYEESSQIIIYTSDSLQLTWNQGDNVIELELTLMLYLNKGPLVDVSLLRTRISIESNSLLSSSSNSSSSPGILQMIPSFLSFHIKAELITINFPDLNLKLSLALLQLRKEESSSYNITCLNFCSHRDAPLLSFDAINFHTSVEKTHVASITKVDVHDLPSLTALAKALASKKNNNLSSSSQRQKQSSSSSRKFEVMVSEITIALEEELKVHLPALAWKMDDEVIGHCVNFDLLSVSWQQNNFLIVQDVFVLFCEKKLSIVVSSSSFFGNRDTLLSLVSKRRPTPKGTSNSVSSNFCKEIQFEMADFTIKFKILPSVDIHFNITNIVYSKRYLEDSNYLEECFKIISLQALLCKLSKKVKFINVEKISISRAEEIIVFELCKETSILWKPDIHLSMHKLSHIMLEVINERTRHMENTSNGERSPKIIIKVNSSNTCVKMLKHELKIATQDCVFELQPTDKVFKFAFPSIFIDADDKFKKIISFAGLIIKFYAHPVRSYHRKDIEGVIDEENRALELFLTHLEINILHELYFHDIFFIEFMGIYKWLKKLHGISGGSGGRLPPDVILYVKQIQIDFHDDPFEVRLKKNYELMEDEHYESEKRKKVLESKIDNFRRMNLMLPVNKIEQIFTDLSRKNTDIYIKRAQNYHAKSSKKAKLWSWSISSMQLMVLADSSMHSPDAVIDFIQSIDQESPWLENMEFFTLLLRWIRFECKLSTMYLKDFPQYLADFKHVLLWGKIALADEAPPERALKEFVLKIDEPFEDAKVFRNMVSTKIYHDIAMDMETFAAAHGPCWEPCLSHFSLLLNNVFGPSSDPSPPLPWWDKIRYIFHGRILIFCKTFKCMLHTSPDPYNTTEEIEVDLFDANFHWSNGGFLKCSGDLDCFIRNETKYDDCQLLHFPGLQFSIKFDWVCIGNPFDHHSVIPCAPNKVPEYSHNFEHDSYRAFRSQNLNTRISIEGKSSLKNRPHIHMYSSTIRWMESIKWLFSGASRPIRRGKVFMEHSPPRKPSIFRHLKRIQISLALKQLQLTYWMSASMNKGVLFNLAHGLSLSAECNLKLVSINDRLIHRKRSEWSTLFINCEFSTADIWFQCTTQNAEEKRFLERSFFFSVENVKYSREMGEKAPVPEEDLLQIFPSHSIVVLGARGAWTESNRDMCFCLYESWKRAHVLRQQISLDYLKRIKVPHTKESNEDSDEEDCASSSAIINVAKKSKNEGELSLSNIATWKTGADTVEKLLYDTSECTNHTPIVYSEDQSSDTKKKDMEAMLACSQNDTYHRRWNIKFINSQMLLKGIETEGHVILSASKAEIVQNFHIPVWRDRTLLSKKSWSGCLESMQCFATVSPNEDGSKLKEDQISWLTQNIIEEREAPVTMVSELVGSGQSVGGVISKIVGSKDEQLQRIISRCKCEFFYVDYDDCEGLLKKIPRPSDFQQSNDNVVNSFSLIHHDLNICTNSLQYSVVLDVLNNLMLYTEPVAKSRSENYLRMKYRLLLYNLEDQWKPITQLQNEVGHLVCLLRRKEKDIYSAQSSGNEDLRSEYESLENEAQMLKDKINSKSEELEIRLRCLREHRVFSRQKQARNYEDAQQLIRRKAEIFFSRAQWRLTENDGQLGILDASISNFFYTKTLMPDDTTEHSLEMGYIYLKNLLPNQKYEDVLYPTELQRDAPLDRHPTLRIFCREKAPVGGISVKEHFEINLSPLTICLTHALYYKIMHFCFPEKPEYEEMDKRPHKKKGSKEKATKSNFYLTPPLNKDDIEMMKDRAQQNKLFVYIKIPEVPICVSYKGEKEKNRISDLTNFVLHVPNIEYHNVTWTWLDLFLAIKSQSKESLISQLIKEKLKLRQRVGGSVGGVAGASHDDGQDNDDEKAKLLLGIRTNPSKTFVKR
ncbi:protein hobbit [Lepeophtheirus salmonis]|uniref:protein hobbit n=1 Tax=Lepeophtheirus salmonis TaxID=72036 RepID=UPI001AE50F1D|nr:protein KIAA0100-like [Lepeophtheirus salmonis]